MARREAEFDYDSMPKRGKIYPDGYYQEAIESVEIGDRGGKKQFVVIGTIEDVGKSTDEYEGQQVWHFFTVGTEDDPTADDPQTWLAKDNYGAQDLVALLVGTKLLRGKEGRAEGKQQPPWELVEDLEGKTFIDMMGVRQGKGKNAGTEYQSHRYFQVGEREPNLLNGAAGKGKAAKHEPREPQGRRERTAVEAE